MLFKHKLTYVNIDRNKTDYLYNLMGCPRDISTIADKINDRNPAEYEENEIDNVIFLKK